MILHILNMSTLIVRTSCLLLTQLKDPFLLFWRSVDVVIQRQNGFHNYTCMCKEKFRLYSGLPEVLNGRHTNVIACGVRHNSLVTS